MGGVLSDFEKVLPPELRGEYTVAAVLKDRPDRQTLLLRHKSGALAVLKRSADGPDRHIYEALSALEGEGVPRILGFYTYDGADLLLREYVEGRTLLELCRERGTFTVQEAAVVGMELCDVLGRLHALPTPLIHRDIKAENVVVTPSGRCVLIDFGIARFHREDDDRDTHIAGTGFAAAPEQFGYAQTDPRSDIYSLGVLLHELVTGEFALERGRAGRLGRVIEKCTRFDPADRYQSAGELRRALLRVRTTPRWAVAAVLLLALCALSVTAFLILRAPSAPPGGEVYVFASPEIGAEVARQLDKDVAEITVEDLGKITALRLAGTRPFDRWEEMNIHGQAFDLVGAADEGMEHGTVSTLTDIPMMPNLEELDLCNQEIEDLTPLGGCGLKFLALHGNAVADLTPLAGCESLEMLVISDNPVRDLTPLAKLPHLWQLNAGATDITNLETLEGFACLSSLDILDCRELPSFDGIEKLTGLRHLSVRPLTRRDLELVGSLTGLNELYAWSGEPVEDLSALAGLVNLERLFADFTNLLSLDGVESFRSLRNLDIRCVARPDVGPLGALKALENVNLSCLDGDWTVLAALPALTAVTVRAECETPVRLALGDRPVTVYVT